MYFQAIPQVPKDNYFVTIDWPHLSHKGDSSHQEELGMVLGYMAIAKGKF